MTAPGCQFSVRTAEPVSAVLRVSVDGEIDMQIAPPASDVQVATTCAQAEPALGQRVPDSTRRAAA